MVRDIKIMPVLNGFICHVGCQKVVFNSLLTMVSNIEKYYSDPDRYEKEFISENKVNDTIDGSIPTLDNEYERDSIAGQTAARGRL